MTATKTFKYAVNHKSKMVVKVHTRDKSLNSFDRLNSSKMSHMSGSSIGISKSHQDLSTKKAKLFSTSTAEFNNDKPIFYSDVYKDGYIARKNKTLSPNELDNSAHRQYQDYERAKESSTQTPQRPLFQKVLDKPMPDFDVNNLLNELHRTHDERFRNFLVLMERYQEENLKLAKQEAARKNSNGKSDEANKVNFIKRFFLKFFTKKSRKVTVTEEKVEFKDQELNEHENELKNFAQLVQKHNDSYSSFRRFVSDQEPSAQLEYSADEKIKALRKKHSEMTNNVINEMEELNVLFDS